MRRDVSKQKTSHTNKWLGKQRKAGEKVRKNNRVWEEESLVYLDAETHDK